MKSILQTLACIALVLVIYTKSAQVTIGWDHSEIIGCDGNPIPIENYTSMGVYYEVQMVRENSTDVFTYVSTPGSNQVTISRPKSGLYNVKVRVVTPCCQECTPEGTCPESLLLICYSLWASSLGPEAKHEDGALGEWKVLFKPTGPTGPVMIY